MSRGKRKFCERSRAKTRRREGTGTERTILHCDMNNFYASCECMERPELRGRPLAVCGSGEERHGIVLAKNYMAKARGVVTGEAVWQARQKCGDLVIAEPHYGLYVKYSKLARQIYSDYTDRVEPYGMDECWLDVTGSGKLYGPGERIADEIRGRVREELGLTISAGVSFNKVFAKLGSDMKKPDATTCIPSGSFREKIWGLPAAALLGVGRAAERKLAGYGIRTIGQLAQTPPQYLCGWMGKWGLYLWKYANGLDDSPVRRSGDALPARSVGRGITALRDLRNGEEVWQVTLALCQDIGETLRECSGQAGGVAVSVRDSGFFTKRWQCPLEIPTRSAGRIAKQAFALFERSYGWSRPIRSLTVTAIDLKPPDAPAQLGLFTDAEAELKAEKLDACVSALRRRFGKNCVMPAALLNNDLMPGSFSPGITMPSGMVTA